MPVRFDQASLYPSRRTKTSPKRGRMYRSPSDPDRPHYRPELFQNRYQSAHQDPLNLAPRRRQEQRHLRMQNPRPPSEIPPSDIIADDNNLMPNPHRLPVNRSHRYPVFEHKQEHSTRYGRPSDYPPSMNNHARSYSMGRQAQPPANGQIRLQMNGHRVARSIDRRGLPMYVSPESNHQRPPASMVDRRIGPIASSSPAVHRNSLSRAVDFDPLEQSLLKSRKRSKQKRRVECLGVVVFACLLAATIGGYVFLVYRTHFWVNDYLTKRAYKIPSWLHVISIFGVVVEVVIIIAFVTRYKHAH